MEVDFGVGSEETSLTPVGPREAGTREVATVALGRLLEAGPRRGGREEAPRGMFAVFGFVCLMDYILCLGKEKKWRQSLWTQMLVAW